MRVQRRKRAEVGRGDLLDCPIGARGRRTRARLAMRINSRISADEEREFYDRVYSAHLQAPDHALRTNRDSIARELTDPAGAFFERRKLYGAVLQRLLSEPLEGLSVLDYGCGLAEWGVFMATEGAFVSLLDLSPVAIEIGLRRAAANGVAGRVRGFARDASDLRCFRDGEFDLIYASAAVHHTLKYPDALLELVRVLRPGGKLILAETCGNNRLLNWLRRSRWSLSGQPEASGEDIILSDRELELLRPHFPKVEVTPMNLFAMAKRLFRGRFRSRTVRWIIGLLEAADDAVLGWAPSWKRYCGEMLVVAEKQTRRRPDQVSACDKMKPDDSREGVSGGSGAAGSYRR